MNNNDGLDFYSAFLGTLDLIYYSFTRVVVSSVATAALVQTDGRMATNLHQTAPPTTTKHPLTFTRGNVD